VTVKRRVADAEETFTLAKGFTFRLELEDDRGRPLRNAISTLIRVDPIGNGRTFLGAQQDCERSASACQFSNVVPGAYVVRVSMASAAGEAVSREFPVVIRDAADLKLKVAR